MLDAPIQSPPRAAKRAAQHFFSVDVEEYFQVTALEAVVPRSSWNARESRVRDSMDRLLELTERCAVQGTFFVLGWIAERHPGLVRQIAAAGHEVASHGWEHRRVTELEPDEFRASVRDSRRVLEDLTGQPVVGYRAPSFSIVPGREWALDVLLEEGYRYDSSLFPIRRPGYGYAGTLRMPHWLPRPGGRLAEFPPTTIRGLGLNLPVAGGGYFRLLPYSVTQFAIRSCEREAMPANVYIHPWEIDPEQPRLPVPFLTRVRHYGRLGSTLPRLERMFKEFSFRKTMVEAMEEL